MVAGDSGGALKPLCEGGLVFVSMKPNDVSGVNVANNGLPACSTPGAMAGVPVRD